MNINQYIRAFPRGQRVQEIKRLAIACDVSYNTLKHAVYKIRKISKSLALPLEKATNGMVKCHESRPDIYPAPYQWE